MSLTHLSSSGGWGSGQQMPSPPAPEPVQRRWAGGLELTTTSPVMTLAPCPGSCRQTRCLFCCFIGLLGPKNWSSGTWERQHLAGTGKGAYLQNPSKPPPLTTTSPCSTVTGGERGCGFLSRAPADPREEPLISQSHSEREKLKMHLFFAPFVRLLCASILDNPGVRSQAVCSAWCFALQEGALWSSGLYLRAGEAQA